MSTKLMSKQKEQEIANSVNKAAQLIADGTHPNDAIAKVAMDMGYNENIAKFMVNSYNVSKTLAQFETQSGEKRAEDFSVANTEAVISKMRASSPSEKKAALRPVREVKDYISVGVDADAFAAKYIHTKAASEADLPDYVLVDRLARLRDDVNSKIAQARADAATAKILASEQFFKVAEMLSNLPKGGFAKFESEILAKHGSVGKHILDDVFATRDFKALGHVRADKTASYVDDSSKEHVAFDRFVSLLKEAELAVKVSNDLSSAADNLAGDLSPINATRGLGAAMSSGTGAVTDFLNNSVLAPMTERQSKGPKVLDDVGVPVDLKNEFNDAGVSSVLSEILGEDDVLKNEDPAEVARIAKQQLEISPNLIQHPPILASAIRRALATRGDVDPFTAKQLFDFSRKNVNDHQGA